MEHSITQGSMLEYVSVVASGRPPKAKHSRKLQGLQECTNLVPTAMHGREGSGSFCPPRVMVELNEGIMDHVDNNPRILSPPLRQGTDERRLQRYSNAEAKLARHLEQCQAELSPRELQIRALEQATTMLSAHAQDARERSERLRKLLADRDTDPEVYETLQRERWFEENRQSIVDQETRDVRENLKILTKACQRDGDPILLEPPENHRMTGEVRRRKNLLTFLAAAPAYPPVRIRKATSVLFERSHKRRTIDRVSPMRLRTTSTISNAPFQPLRPTSLDGWTRRSRHASESRASATREPRDTPIRMSLRVVTEDQSPTADEDMAQSSATASTSVSSFTEFSTNTTTATTFTPYTPTSQYHRNTMKSEDGENGTVIIYRNAALDMEFDTTNIDAPIPDYALDLFSRFDAGLPIIMTSAQFPSPPTTRWSDVGPRQAESDVEAGPSRHSTSLQVPSPASPKQRLVRRISRVRRSSSFRHLGSLISIPESLSSSEKRAQNPKDVTTSMVSSAVSLTLPTVSGGAKEGKNDLSSKIKKRFSSMRLVRS